MKRVVAGMIFAMGVLLTQPAAADLTGPAEWYTIANAAAANKTDDVAQMIRRGDNPNFIDSFGRTPLGYAAAFDNVRMLKLLLDADARIDYRDSFGSTALHWAAEKGSVESIKVLLAAKAPVDAINKQGITPLMLAAGANKGEAVRVLLESGADPKKQDYTGRDARSWAQGKPNSMRALQSAHAG